MFTCRWTLIFGPKYGATVTMTLPPIFTRESSENVLPRINFHHSCGSLSWLDRHTRDESWYSGEHFPKIPSSLDGNVTLCGPLLRNISRKRTSGSNAQDSIRHYWSSDFRRSGTCRPDFCRSIFPVQTFADQNFCWSLSRLLGQTFADYLQIFADHVKSSKGTLKKQPLTFESLNHIWGDRSNKNYLHYGLMEPGLLSFWSGSFVAHKPRIIYLDDLTSSLDKKMNLLHNTRANWFNLTKCCFVV